MANKKNPGLKKSNVSIEYTPEMISELKKCAVDPVYFIRNYVYIKHAKRGKIKFNMYPYQEEMVRRYHSKRFNIVLSARQTGKTETSCAFLLWSAIFKSDQTILVASNKSANAMEIIAKIQYAYEELPLWLKPGIDENSWNKHTCAFDNKSRIVATTTSADSGRGMAISLLYCDEFAFVKPHISEQFYDSILPTISTGGAMIISSTPNGDVGKFASLWRGAKAGLNEFKDGITYVPWNAPPGRDEEFKKKFKGLLGERKWRQEYECVTGDTLVTVRNKLTGTVEQITVHELKMRLLSNMNINYEVLTEYGFKDFLDVSSKVVDKTLVITFSDSMKLRCTPDHMLKLMGGEFIEAKNLEVGCEISPIGSVVVGVVQIDEPVEVYDLVNVEDGNHYLTNGLTSHNCEFLTEELTLVDSDAITTAEIYIQQLIEAGELIKFAVRDNRFQFFRFLKKDTIYIVAADPSTGNGSDNGVIQVFEFPSMEQVLEYTTNTLSPQVFYTELKALLRFLEQATQEIYFSVENNGVGMGVLAAYEGDMDPPTAMLVSHKGMTGVNSNTKTKLRACLQFKEAFERGKIKIYSPDLLTELKSFVRHSGSYAAQTGATDDRIMATMVAFYIIQEISSSNPDAYDMVYTVAAEIEERHAWTAEQENKKLQETSTPQEGRSDILEMIFAKLHGDDSGSSGFTVG